ncbi:MAG TPA: hypothetical protein GX693_01515 [Firmicutes bacterium]|nr:hypothetical protein [Bacillota bacterium]
MQTAVRSVGKAEFMSLFHQYQSESLCSKKLLMYSELVQDTSLRNIISELNSQCQQRSKWLSSTLSEAGGSNYIS